MITARRAHPFARRALRAAAPLAAMLVAAGCTGPFGPFGGCAAEDFACRAERTAIGYAALEAWYLDEGRLRTERAPADAPLSAELLADHFRTVAFNTEFAPGATLLEEETPARLSRWSGAPRWRLEGDGIQPADLEELRSLAARIARITRLDLTQAAPFEQAPGAPPGVERRETAPQIQVLILGPAAREALSASIAERGAVAPLVAAWARSDEYPCVGLSLERGGAGSEEGPSGALVMIKAELRGLLRRACLHEEFVQILGLPNDGPQIRPSIFNDDQEFALLTEHDELLLRILYDPRLKPGMTEAEGMPIVRRIARELMAKRARKHG
ncbi:DUF2927 domain-containing protein [Rhodovulum sp. DZ06]|uniref:DUF2927 domain-containing protein n=1 Tax=Rhodovulum sp. DZ06 TaxID=3425126 RepID=UPI003D33846E